MKTEQSRIVGTDDRVMISYEVRCHGQVLEASESGEYVEYQMGAGHWPVQLELTLLGEAVGQQLEIELKAGDYAFGKPDPERIIQMDRIDFDDEPEAGELIEFTLDNGDIVEGQVLSVLADKIEVDFNHPYAGRDLSFSIHIGSIL